MHEEMSKNELFQGNFWDNILHFLDTTSSVVFPYGCRDTEVQTSFQDVFPRLNISSESLFMIFNDINSL